MTKNLRFLPAAALVVLAACSDGGDAGQMQQMPPPAVTVVTIDAQPVTLSRELPGRTSPYRVAEVRPQVTGIVRERLFEEGARVEAGQPLYQLDDATYRADAQSAAAALARAEAAVESARLQAARSDELRKIDAISAQEHENATAALRLAEADVGVARAAAERARVVLGYAEVRSPIDGIVGRSAVTPGALVTANQSEPLTTVQQLDPIYVDLTQSGAELMRLRRALASGAARLADETPVTIQFEDGTEYAHPGKLTFSAVSVDPSTGSFALRAVVPNPDHLLMPGMYVRAVVASAVREQGILVPQQAVQRDPKGNASVMVVNADGVAEARPIVVSRAVGNRWLVDEGLAPGDRVITEGLQKVQPGAPVQPTPAQAD
jgi:membrane fusion protein, multidrug efflux system